MQATKTNAFERYGYHFSRGKREGLVFPICYAEMLSDEGVSEGELSVAIMNDHECRFGFFELKGDKFLDMEVIQDPDVPDNLLIERDYKGKPVKLKEDQEKECIIGVQFKVSSQLQEYSGIQGSLTIANVIKHAADLLEGAVYHDGFRKKGRDIPFRSMPVE